MSVLSINTTFNIQLNFELAPLHKRILALLLDYLILIFYLVFVFNLTSIKFTNIFDDDNKDFQTTVIVLLVYLPCLFYSLLFEVLLKGQTPGKKIMNIIVISEDGNDATRSQLFIRWALKPIDTISFGYMVGLIAAAASKNSQRIGDMAAGTAVVNTGLPYTINQTILKDINIENYKVIYPEVMKLSDRDLNTINNIIKNNRDFDYISDVAVKVANVLNVVYTDHPHKFLNQLLKDYNYLVKQK
jgi:uncharacterized RDD family membrane protein YckC